MRLSVIIPVLNEADSLAASLRRLHDEQPALFEGDNRVVVVDGGSNDGSAGCVDTAVFSLLVSDRGRARQMNAGAAATDGEVLLFLHADTRLPANARGLVEAALQDGAGWGRFDLALSGNRPVYRFIAALINLRSRLTSVATGDQAIFVRRELFDAVGGYPDIELMEDVALSKSLRRFHPAHCIRQPVVTSSRRWEQKGVVRTVLLMWWLRMLYVMGVSPARLARLYR